MSSKRSAKSHDEGGESSSVNGTGENTEEEIEISEDEESEQSSADKKKKKPAKACSYNKSAFSMPDDIKKLMERVLCCSCGKQLNPMNQGAVRRHPWLKVMTCKKCYKFLKSGPFTRDKDGTDEQCRWCGDGGHLYGCDFCNNCFCRSCIKRNLGRSEAAAMETEGNLDSKWKCYVCKPKKISKLVGDCSKIIEYVQKEEQKEQEREERAKLREKEKQKAKEKQREEKHKEHARNRGKNEIKEKVTIEKGIKFEGADESSNPKRSLPAPKGKGKIVECFKTEKKDHSLEMKRKSEVIVVDDNTQRKSTTNKMDPTKGINKVFKSGTWVNGKVANSKSTILPSQTYVEKFSVGMVDHSLATNAIYQNVNRGIKKELLPPNDMSSLKNGVSIVNVEYILEKMKKVAESLKLMVSSVETDIAIAKLTSTNTFQAKTVAVDQFRHGIDVFFQSLTDTFNVQLVAYGHESFSVGEANDLSTLVNKPNLTKSQPKNDKEDVIEIQDSDVFIVNSESAEESMNDVIEVDMINETPEKDNEQYPKLANTKNKISKAIFVDSVDTAVDDEYVSLSEDDTETANNEASKSVCMDENVKKIKDIANDSDTELILKKSLIRNKEVITEEYNNAVSTISPGKSHMESDCEEDMEYDSNYVENKSKDVENDITDMNNSGEALPNQMKSDENVSINLGFMKSTTKSLKEDEFKTSVTVKELDVDPNQSCSLRKDQHEEDSEGISDSGNFKKSQKENIAKTDEDLEKSDIIYSKKKYDETLRKTNKSASHIEETSANVDTIVAGEKSFKDASKNDKIEDDADLTKSRMSLKERKLKDVRQDTSCNVDKDSEAMSNSNDIKIFAKKALRDDKSIGDLYMQDNDDSKKLGSMPQNKDDDNRKNDVEDDSEGIPVFVSTDSRKSHKGKKRRESKDMIDNVDDNTSSKRLKKEDKCSISGDNTEDYSEGMSDNDGIRNSDINIRNGNESKDINTVLDNADLKKASKRNQNEDEVSKNFESAAEFESSQDKIDESLNIAAELELLKSLADEINESERNASEESQESKRSTRNRGSEEIDTESDNINETLKRSSMIASQKSKEIEDHSDDENDEASSVSHRKGKKDKSKKSNSLADEINESERNASEESQESKRSTRNRGSEEIDTESDNINETLKRSSMIASQKSKEIEDHSDDENDEVSSVSHRKGKKDKSKKSNSLADEINESERNASEESQESKRSTRNRGSEEIDTESDNINETLKRSSMIASQKSKEIEDHSDDENDEASSVSHRKGKKDKSKKSNKENEKIKDGNKAMKTAKDEKKLPLMAVDSSSGSESDDSDSSVSEMEFGHRKKRSARHAKVEASPIRKTHSQKQGTSRSLQSASSKDSKLSIKNERKQKLESDIDSDIDVEKRTKNRSKETSQSKQKMKDDHKSTMAQKNKADKKSSKIKQSSNSDTDVDADTEKQTKSQSKSKKKGKDDAQSSKTQKHKTEDKDSDSDTDVDNDVRKQNKRQFKMKWQDDTHPSKTQKQKDKTKDKNSDSGTDVDADVGKQTKSQSKSKRKGKDDTDSSKALKNKEKAEEKLFSDSDTDFDADLEKQIKSLSKDVKLPKKKLKEDLEMENNKKQKDKAENQKSKENKSLKGKKIILDSEHDDDDDMGETEDNDNKQNSDEDDDDIDSNVEKELSRSQIEALKLAEQAACDDSNSDNEDNDDGVEPDKSEDDSSDSEVTFSKLATPEKGKKKIMDDEDKGEDSDFVTPKQKPRLRMKLLDAKLTDSEEEDDIRKKKGKGHKRKKSDTEEEEDSEQSEVDKKGKGKKKRRRIRKISSSDENEREPGAGNDVDTGEDDDGTPGGYLKRKKIRKVQGTKKLADETKAAQKAEEERRQRIADRQKEYNSYVEVQGTEDEVEKLPDGIEQEFVKSIPANDSIAEILASPKKIPITTKCILDMDKDKKLPLIEVDRTLIRKLKPHQVEAVRFMYNCCIESVERIKEDEGAGCIVAHCMGLGKTLSVITFVHTMLSNQKLTKMSSCLVVCPLNIILNWVHEFEIWLEDLDFEIEVYEMSKVKGNFQRAEMLKEWHESSSAVMIIGYEMYRNLVMGSHCKNKKQKKIFYETLAEPGPDLVVCDEGHILKNDQTTLSKSMNKIKTRRRIVLTGTPLQNNLREYHCMVDFVKPSLLGTRKEFYNRFANPITNGQCSDSTPADVKVMKRRAHILHELLAGCVQRKDYSALTKYLPPKFEYVISVRLSKVQMTLYEKYLEIGGLGDGGIAEIQSKGTKLFRDYQALMRIWTHPWVLKLDEIRRENKRCYSDDEDSFIGTDSDGEDSMLSGSTSSISSDSEKDQKSDKENKAKKNSSDDDNDVDKNDKVDEVVKKWTLRRRGNDQGAGSSLMEDIDMGYGQEQGPKEVTSEWWAEYVKEDDDNRLELSGKLSLLFEILKMCEDIGDKVLVFSQSLLSLDIIEDFLHKVDEANNGTAVNTAADESGAGDGKAGDGKVGDGKMGAGDSKMGAGDGETDIVMVNGDIAKDDENASAGREANGEKDSIQKAKNQLSQYGKSWTKGADYFRMDGSTNSQYRKVFQDMFNSPENFRARLFLISTKAGSLGVNLVAANRVIIFDASWNPSHDIQSIFRVYRFGQVKPVYVYRFLAQGTMEEKIYERQVTKQSLSQRVVDEHQIERHFTASDLQELYKFQPDRLDDPNRKERLPMLPKDHMLAELMTQNKEWIVTFHEHDSLLENVVSQELNEEEKKAAWEDYENEKKGITKAIYSGTMNSQFMGDQQANMQNLLMMGQANLGQQAVLQIVQDLKTKFPDLSPDIFQQRVQAVLKQVLTQQIMQQTEMQRRQLEQQKLNELNRLNKMKQRIQQQQAILSGQQQQYGIRMGSLMGGVNQYGVGQYVPQMLNVRPPIRQMMQQQGDTMNLMTRLQGSSMGLNLPNKPVVPMPAINKPGSQK